MDVRSSDKILATISKFEQGEIIGCTKKWSNISKLVISSPNENKSLVPGQEISVEVDRIEGKTAYVTVTRAPYARIVWPGDTVEVTPTHFSSDGLAVANHTTTSFDVVHIIGAVPEDTVVVKILRIRDEVAIGETVKICSEGIRVGDQIEASVKEGSSVGKTEKGAFDAQLATRAYTDAKITIEITSLDGKVQAKIIDPGVLPMLGNELEASVERDSKAAQILEGNYEINLDKPALATGDVVVSIDQANKGETPVASITSYNGLIPNVGDLVSVWSIENSAKAKPQTGTYRVSLSAKIPVSTRFRVEIISCEENIEGKLSDVGSLPVAGNEINAEISRGSSKAVASIGEYEIELPSSALASGTVPLQIKSPPKGELAKGEIKSYGDLLPSVGETLTVFSSRGKSIIKPKGETYAIELDEITLIKTEICVKILNINKDGVYGEIIDQGELIDEGDCVRANVFFEKNYAKTKSGYRINLKEKSIISGVATVKVTKMDASKVSGSIIEHHSLPEIGDTVHAKIEVGRTVAKPTQDRYHIYLQTPAKISGGAIVEITAINDQIRGKVIRRNSKRAHSDKPFKQEGSKNSLISRGKL